MSIWPLGNSATAALAWRQSVSSVSTAPLAGSAAWRSGRLAAAGSMAPVRPAEEEAVGRLPSWAWAQAAGLDAARAASPNWIRGTRKCARRMVSPERQTGQRTRGQVPRHARKRAAHGGAAGMARTHFGRQASGNGWLDGLQLGRAGKARAALGAQCGGRRCAVRTDLARSEKGRMADAAQGAAGPMFRSEIGRAHV